MVHQQYVENTSSKILYIDDDPDNRSLINRLLTNYNFRVLEADTGLKGIAVAQTEHPDLILMDINMPGLDGHETTTRMRSISALQKVPIVAVTARTTKGERELALAAGCDGYISKPIDVDTFPDQIVSYLDGYKDTITKDEQRHYLGHYSRKLVDHLEAKIVELEQANRQLHKIDKLKSDFITLTAHELRTPITLVYGYARLLQAEAKAFEHVAPATSDIGELAERIFASIQRLNEVVNDILNISLIQANEMRLSHEPVILAEIIEAALRELNPAQNGRNLNIITEGLDMVSAVVGDKPRLQQVFWNILSNAIKFTVNGGSILIRAWPVASSPAPKSSQNGPPGVVIAVKDSGIGIRPSDHKEIFDRFYIVGDTDYHSSSKTAFEGGGLGLGLTIARGIVEAHSGQIWVESKGRNVNTNPGSTFYVFLPQSIPDQ